MSAEAIRMPALGALFWAEATPDGTGVRAIAGTLPVIDLALTIALPRGVALRQDARGVVLLAPAISYDHPPSEAELAMAPTPGAAAIGGVSTTRDGRYNPRRFTAALSPAAPTSLKLWPSPMAARVGEAGAVALTLAWTDGRPASWCILRLSCTRSGQTYGFAGQCDLAGDVIVPLTGLPPLPTGQPTDGMTITVAGLPAQSGLAAADPDAAVPVHLASGGAYAAQQSLPITRGRFTTTKSLGLAVISLQAP